MFVLVADHTKESMVSAVASLTAMTDCLPSLVYSDGEKSIRSGIQMMFGGLVQVEYDYFHLLNAVFKKHLAKRPKMFIILKALIHCESVAAGQELISSIKGMMKDGDEYVVMRLYYICRWLNNYLAEDQLQYWVPAFKKALFRQAMVGDSISESMNNILGNMVKANTQLHNLLEKLQVYTG